MINLEIKLFQLQKHLRDYGIEDSDVHTLVQEAKDIIYESIDELTQAAMQDAVLYAEEQGVYEFAQELTVDQNGLYRTLSSKRGTFRFNYPERQNLNNLLKNGEIADDGSKYKIIPVGKKSFSSSFDQMKAQSAIQSEARAAMIGKNMSKRASQLSEALQAKIRDRVQNVASRSPEFKTASSKQDPQKSWVIPERDVDLTEYMENLNSQLQAEITNTIDNTIDYYMDAVR